MPAQSIEKRGIRRIAPVALAAIVATMAPAAATGASASTALPPVKATASLFSCFTNPMRVTPAGMPGPNPDKICMNDQVGGARSTGSAGSVQVTATGVSGITTVNTGAVAIPTGNATEAATSWTVRGQAVASTKSAHLVVGKTVIELGAITTKSTITCTYGAKSARFSFNSTSTVRSLKINGKPMNIGNGAKSIPLPTGTLMLNHSTVTARGVTQHAAMVHTATADVALGEAAVAVANTPNNPCQP